MPIPFHFTRMGRNFRINAGHQYKMYNESAVMYESTESDLRNRIYVVMPLQIAKKDRLSFGNKKVKKGEIYLPAFKRWQKLGHFFTDINEAWNCWSLLCKLPSHT